MGTAGVAGYQRPRRMFRFEPIERCALAVFDNGAGGFPRRWVPRDQAASFKRAVTADNLFVHLVLSGMMIPLMAALWLFRGRLFGTAPVIVAWLACNLVFFPLFLLQQSRMKRGGGLGSFRFALDRKSVV